MEEMMDQGFLSVVHGEQGKEDTEESFDSIQHKFIIKNHNSWAWCHKGLMPALERLSQEDHSFEISLGYAGSSRLTSTAWWEPISNNNKTTKLNPKAQIQTVITTISHWSKLKLRKNFWNWWSDMEKKPHSTRVELGLPRGQDQLWTLDSTCKQATASF